jgi:RNA recognition motif-containing protein
MTPRSSRSRSPREERRRNRSRTPLNGAVRYEEGADGQRVHSGKEANQDKRVYVGNLSYDVKWHQLKDHMGSGTNFRFFSDRI